MPFSFLYAPSCAGALELRHAPENAVLFGKEFGRTAFFRHFTIRKHYDFVRRFNAEGITIIMITHDMSAIRYASHILSLGAFPFFGTKDDFLQTENGKRLTASGGMTAEAYHA